MDKKQKVGLDFQKEWVKDFKKNKSMVLDYWKKYRYFDDIIKYTNLDKNKKVIDIGCGISTVLHFLPNKSIGIDPLVKYYKNIYKYPTKIKVIAAPGEKIPFPDKSFDVAFCSNALDHTSSPKLTINEIWRILKPGGFFIITVEIFDKYIKRDVRHPHSLTEKKLLELLKPSFEIIYMKKSPWIGLRYYVQGSKKSVNFEIILICKPKYTLRKKLELFWRNII